MYISGHFHIGMFDEGLEKILAEYGEQICIPLWSLDFIDLLNGEVERDHEAECLDFIAFAESLRDNPI